MRHAIIEYLTLPFRTIYILWPWSKLVYERIKALQVLLNLVNALFAENEPFRRLKDLAFYHEGSLPTFHPIPWTLKLGSLRPHSIYMLEVVLELLYTITFLILLFSHDLLEILALLDICHLLCLRAVFYLFPHLVQIVLALHHLFNFVKFVVLSNCKLFIVISPSFLHFIELIERQSTRNLRTGKGCPKAG